MRRALLCLLALSACTSEQRAPAAETAPAPTPAPVVVTPPPAAPAETPAPGRALTAGEIALARPLFGASIDYAAVRVIPDRYFLMQPPNVYMTPNGNIHAPGALFEADFSADTVTPSLRALFIHEMTHVWQHQSGFNLILGGIVEFLRQAGEYGKAYPYQLEPTRDLIDYGLEQQASILEDRARMALGLQPWRIANVGLSDAARDALYARVLRRFLADPGYARALAPEELHARLGRVRSDQP